MVTVVIAMLAASGVQAATMSVELLRCAKVEGRLERLHCYDALADLVANSKVVTIPVEDLGAYADPQRYRSNAQPVQDDFGLKTSRKADIGAAIADITQLARGEYRLTLDNDQVWQEIEANSRAKYAIGDKVTIKRTVVGAFRLRVDKSGFTNKVTRIR